MKYYLFSLVSLFAHAGYTQSESVFDFTRWTHPDSIVLPNPCELLPLSTSAKVLEIDVNNINEKSAKSAGNSHYLSCFYRWEDPTTPHAGMLFQVMKNGVPENPDFISRTYKSKITEGEFLQHLERKVKYKKHVIGKVEIAYNPVTYAVFWHIGDNYMFHLIFNLNSLNEDRFLTIIEQIVPEVNKNMLNHLLK